MDAYDSTAADEGSVVLEHLLEQEKALKEQSHSVTKLISHLENLIEHSSPGYSRSYNNKVYDVRDGDYDANESRYAYNNRMRLKRLNDERRAAIERRSQAIAETSNLVNEVSDKAYRLARKQLSKDVADQFLMQRRGWRLLRILFRKANVRKSLQQLVSHKQKELIRQSFAVLYKLTARKQWILHNLRYLIHRKSWRKMCGQMFHILSFRVRHRRAMRKVNRFRMKCKARPFLLSLAQCVRMKLRHTAKVDLVVVKSRGQFYSHCMRFAASKAMRRWCEYQKRARRRAVVDKVFSRLHIALAFDQLFLHRTRASRNSVASIRERRGLLLQGYRALKALHRLHLQRKEARRRRLSPNLCSIERVAKLRVIKRFKGKWSISASEASAIDQSRLFMLKASLKRWHFCARLQFLQVHETNIRTKAYRASVLHQAIAKLKQFVTQRKARANLQAFIERRVFQTRAKRTVIRKLKAMVGIRKIMSKYSRKAGMCRDHHFRILTRRDMAHWVAWTAFQRRGRTRRSSLLHEHLMRFANAGARQWFAAARDLIGRSRVSKTAALSVLAVKGKYALRSMHAKQATSRAQVAVYGMTRGEALLSRAEKACRRFLIRCGMKQSLKITRHGRRRKLKRAAEVCTRSRMQKSLQTLRKSAHVRIVEALRSAEFDVDTRCYTLRSYFAYLRFRGRLLGHLVDAKMHYRYRAQTYALRRLYRLFKRHQKRHLHKAQGCSVFFGLDRGFASFKLHHQFLIKTQLQNAGTDEFAAMQGKRRMLVVWVVYKAAARYDYKQSNKAVTFHQTRMHKSGFRQLRQSFLERRNAWVEKKAKTSMKASEAPTTDAAVCELDREDDSKGAPVHLAWKALMGLVLCKRREEKGIASLESRRGAVGLAQFRHCASLKVNRNFFIASRFSMSYRTRISLQLLRSNMLDGVRMMHKQEAADRCYRQNALLNVMDAWINFSIISSDHFRSVRKALKFRTKRQLSSALDFWNAHRHLQERNKKILSRFKPCFARGRSFIYRWRVYRATCMDQHYSLRFGGLHHRRFLLRRGFRVLRHKQLLAYHRNESVRLFRLTRLFPMRMLHVVRVLRRKMHARKGIIDDSRSLLRDMKQSRYVFNGWRNFTLGRLERKKVGLEAASHINGLKVSNAITCWKFAVKVMAYTDSVVAKGQKKFRLKVVKPAFKLWRRLAPSFHRQAFALKRAKRFRLISVWQKFVVCARRYTPQSKHAKRSERAAERHFDVYSQRMALRRVRYWAVNWMTYRANKAAATHMQKMTLLSMAFYGYREAVFAEGTPFLLARDLQHSKISLECLQVLGKLASARRARLQAQHQYKHRRLSRTFAWICRHWRLMSRRRYINEVSESYRNHKFTVGANTQIQKMGKINKRQRKSMHRSVNHWERVKQLHYLVELMRIVWQKHEDERTGVATKKLIKMEREKYAPRHRNLTLYRYGLRGLIDMVDNRKELREKVYDVEQAIFAIYIHRSFVQFANLCEDRADDRAVMQYADHGKMVYLQKLGLRKFLKQVERHARVKHAAKWYHVQQLKHGLRMWKKNAPYVLPKFHGNRKSRRKGPKVPRYPKDMHPSQGNKSPQKSSPYSIRRGEFPKHDPRLSCEGDYRQSRQRLATLEATRNKEWKGINTSFRLWRKKSALASQLKAILKGQREEKMSKHLTSWAERTKDKVLARRTSRSYYSVYQAFHSKMLFHSLVLHRCMKKSYRAVHTLRAQRIFSRWKTKTHNRELGRKYLHVMTEGKNFRIFHAYFFEWKVNTWVEEILADYQKESRVAKLRQSIDSLVYARRFRGHSRNIYRRSIHYRHDRRHRRVIETILKFIGDKYKAKDRNKAAHQYYLDYTRRHVLSNLLFFRRNRIAQEHNVRKKFNKFARMLYMSVLASKYDRSLMHRANVMCRRRYFALWMAVVARRKEERVPIMTASERQARRQFILKFFAVRALRKAIRKVFRLLLGIRRQRRAIEGVHSQRASYSQNRSLGHLLAMRRKRRKARKLGSCVDAVRQETAQRRALLLFETKVAGRWATKQSGRLMDLHCRKAAMRRGLMALMPRVRGTERGHGAI